MTRQARCGYEVRTGVPGMLSVCVDTGDGEFFLRDDIYDALSDEEFSEFVLAWKARDERTLRRLCGEDDGLSGLEALAARTSASAPGKRPWRSPRITPCH